MTTTAERLDAAHKRIRRLETLLTRYMAEVLYQQGITYLEHGAHLARDEVAELRHFADKASKYLAKKGYEE